MCFAKVMFYVACSGCSKIALSTYFNVLFFLVVPRATTPAIEGFS